MEIERLYDTDQLAAHIRESRRTIERWRQEGTGPDYVKAGKRVLYRLSAVEDWIERNTFTSTAKARAAKDVETAEIARRYEGGQRTIAEAKAEADRRYPQQNRPREAAEQAKEARE